MPFSGGNWPPAFMKFLKDDAGRLNDPSGSDLYLDMSDMVPNRWRVPMPILAWGALYTDEVTNGER